MVIPTLDEGPRIARLVERLLSADSRLDRADEVVIADGGSSDGTRELAEHAGARGLSAIRGRGSQLAAGARDSHSDVLVFLHADNFLPLGALAVVRAAFADRRVGAAALRQRIVAEGWFYRAVERAADRRVRRSGIVYGDSTLCIRRELYERIGGFAQLPLFEDVELSKRLRRFSRVVLLDGLVEVDARRWRREGRVRTTVRNVLLRAAYTLGVAPRTLERWYPPFRAGSSIPLERGPR